MKKINIIFILFFILLLVNSSSAYKIGGVDLTRSNITLSGNGGLTLADSTRIASAADLSSTDLTGVAYNASLAAYATRSQLNATNATRINWTDVNTTLANPGQDTKLVSEKAVRTAIEAIEVGDGADLSGVFNKTNINTGFSGTSNSKVLGELGLKNLTDAINSSTGSGLSGVFNITDSYGKVNDTGDSMTGSLNITTSDTRNAFKIDQNAATSSSSSVGGAFLLENTGNTGAGEVIYSNAGASQGDLLTVRADNAVFNQSGIYVQYDGTNHGISIDNAGTGSLNTGLRVHSDNEESSAMWLIGKELAHGTLKINHEGDVEGNDANAAALSIDLSGAGTAAQGIFATSTGPDGTTGDILNLRNNISGVQTELLNLNDSGVLTMGNNYLNMDSHKISNLSNGVAAGDAVNKGQLDLIVAEGADLSGVYNITDSYGKVNDTGDSMTGALNITNAGTWNALKIDQNGQTSNSASTGGAVLIENTGNQGIGLAAYTNHAGALGPLVSIKSDNAAFNQSALYVTQDGTADSINAVHHGTGTSSAAIRASSDNVDASTSVLSGSQVGYPTSTITHTGTGADTGSSVLELVMNGAGTATKGLSIVANTASGGTSGNVLDINNRIANTPTDLLTLNATGKMTLHNNNLSMNSKYITDLHAPSIDADAATKGYVDSAVSSATGSSNVTDSSANIALDDSENQFVLCGNSGANQTITLKDAATSDWSGKPVKFSVKTDPGANYVRIVAVGGDLVGGGAVLRTTDLDASIEVVSNGATYTVISHEGSWTAGDA